MAHRTVVHFAWRLVYLAVIALALLAAAVMASGCGVHAEVNSTPAAPATSPTLEVPSVFFSHGGLGNYAYEFTTPGGLHCVRVSNAISCVK